MLKLAIEGRRANVLRKKGLKYEREVRNLKPRWMTGEGPSKTEEKLVNGVVMRSDKIKEKGRRWSNWGELRVENKKVKWRLDYKNKKEEEKGWRVEERCKGRKIKKWSGVEGEKKWKVPEHEVEQWRDEEDKKREVQGEEQMMELEPGKHKKWRLIL